MTRLTHRDIANYARMPQNDARWYRIYRDQATGAQEISIYDEIGLGGITAQDFCRDLDDISGPVSLRLNTGGGEVFEGLAIYNALRQRQDVRITIDGLAASIGSVIAMAASPGRLSIAKTASLMIHDAFSFALGNASDMRALADQLDAQSENIAGIYADRTGKPVSYWRNQMQNETWFVGQQAVDAGLADRLAGADEREQLTIAALGYVLVNADGNHAPMSGTHTHSHAAYGSQGGDAMHAHEHAHDGDANHGHSHDPDGDGDDDTSAAGDTDHDYVLPDGSPGPKANRSDGLWLNADKYKQADRDRMAANGHAMPDGSYPIEDAEDLDNAIKAVGRGGADHDAIRRHVIKRAAALGESAQIPDDWNSDGSMKSSGSPDDLADPHLLAAIFSNALGGVSTR
jgi:ATP-dependent protease ClpP protease subunit